MKKSRFRKLAVVFLLLFCNGCAGNYSAGSDNSPAKNDSAGSAGIRDEEVENETKSEENRRKLNEPNQKIGDQPKNVREFFMVLPEKYFQIECCEGSKKEYLKNYLTVEDLKNGFMEGGGDAAQNGFTMAIFKRPDQTYIVGFYTFGEAQDSYYFLEYRDEKWFDVSAREVPEYDQNNMYEFPRYGTTMEVFSKKVLERDGEFEIVEKGEKLYSLEWKDGKFRIIR